MAKKILTIEQKIVLADAGLDTLRRDARIFPPPIYEERRNSADYNRTELPGERPMPAPNYVEASIQYAEARCPAPYIRR